MSNEITNKVRRIKAGIMLYKVYVLDNPRQAWMVVQQAVGRPFFYQSKGFSDWKALFVRVRVIREDGPTFEQDISLKDAGLLSTRHNAHQTFFSRKKALRYLKQLQDGMKPFNSEYKPSKEYLDSLIDEIRRINFE